MVDLEKKYQKEWEEARYFETDAPLDETTLTPEELQAKYPKWMGNFAYPYMNGSLHLGHAFTVSKVEFNAGFQRLLGKRVLFPLGYHATGMPIKVCPVFLRIHCGHSCKHRVPLIRTTEHAFRVLTCVIYVSASTATLIMLLLT